VRILLIGLPAAGRLESVQHAVRDVRADVDFEATPSIAVLQSSAPIEPPEFILVFQDWPEQYTQAEVDWFLSNHPTSRMLCVYGSFCEADGRTRSIWPHAVRVPQWGLTNRLRRELPTTSGTVAPRLPLTASRRERFLFEHESRRDSPVFPGRAIRIVTPDRALAGALTALLDLPRQSVTPPDVILFDVDPWCAESRQELEGLARHYPQARLIALAGFPSHTPVVEITAAGAAAVLPKMLTADELVDALRQCEEPKTDDPYRAAPNG
jgi:hypothetical protein